jgi:hypothetical protein
MNLLWVLLLGKVRQNPTNYSIANLKNVLADDLKH